VLATAFAAPIAIGAGVLAWRLSLAQEVVVPGRPATADGRRQCAALISALPDSLGTLNRRTVRGDQQSTAAWGDPPVGLKCDAPRPAGAVGEVINVDGVDWVPAPDATGVSWTTAGRRLTVLVRFPKRYDSQGPLLARLSPAVRRAVPVG